MGLWTILGVLFFAALVLTGMPRGSSATTGPSPGTTATSEPSQSASQDDASPGSTSTTEQDPTEGQAASSIVIQTNPLADFYFTLRSLTEDGRDQKIPEEVRSAAVRLTALTRFLPDSLPLRTPEGTVLIVHRKNPKYQAHVERLLWRRLDPGLGMLRTRDDMPGVLQSVRDSMRPLCGSKADSIGDELESIYESSYSRYLSSIWQGRKSDLESWINAIHAQLGERQPQLLDRLSRDLKVPLLAPNELVVCLVAAGVPDESVVLRPGGSAVSRPDDRHGATLILCRSGSGPEAAVHLLRAYLQGSRLMRPTGESVPDVLRKTAEAAKLDPSVFDDLETALVDCAIASALQDVAGIDASPVRVSEKFPRPASREMRRGWSAHLAGLLTVEEACQVFTEATLPRE